MAEFQMAEGIDTKEVTETAKRTAHERVIKVLDSIYAHNQTDFEVLQEAQMRVYACTCVVNNLLDGQPYWKAVTQAVISVLTEYPLQGYPLKKDLGV